MEDRDLIKKSMLGKSISFYATLREIDLFKIVKKHYNLTRSDAVRLAVKSFWIQRIKTNKTALKELRQKWGTYS